MDDLMQVEAFDYVDLIDAVQTELRIMNENNPQLTPEQHEELSHFFKAFITLAEQKTFWNFDTSFTMVLNGIPDNLYNEFQVISQKIKIPVHKLFNILMNEGMDLSNGEILSANVLKKYTTQHARYSINNYHSLTITNEDLMEVDYPVNLSNIHELTFTSDVGEQFFFEKINAINNCHKINFLNPISKLAALTKIQNCDLISFIEQ